MKFEKIPAHLFEYFHTKFKGDNPEIFEVCSKCRGACEYNKIGTLLPGEKEYMAEKVRLSVTEFADKYLDVLEMSDGVRLDVLKFVDGCPFLNGESYECECRSFKVILCETYPIVFSVEKGQVNFFIDDWCPLSDTLRFRRYFEEVGIPLISELPIPLAWFEYVATYDHLYFDYKALQKNRRHLDRCEVFSIKELLRFQRKDVAKQPCERWHPYPEENIRDN